MSVVILYLSDLPFEKDEDHSEACSGQAKHQTGTQTMELSKEQKTVEGLTY